MSNSYLQIVSYIKTQSRNKIVIHQMDIPDLKSLNTGEVLAQEIQNISNKKHLSLKVKSKLNDILSNAITNNDLYGKILSIKNIGILFEPDLKLDFFALIDNYSKNNTLFIQWDGEIENNKLFFLSKSIGIEINIKNLSHIVL